MIFHVHRYHTTNSSPYVDTSWGEERHMTRVFNKCRCQKIKKELVDGWWDWNPVTEELEYAEDRYHE